VRAAAEYAALLASSLSTAELAQRLGVDESRVRQLLSEHALYGIKGRKAWRIPAFQLDDTGRRLLPGLHLIIPHLADAHPVEVASWFTSPQVDLEGPDEVPLSPRQWLLTGGDPRVLATVAEEFDGLS
jgi:excisionase family DNA binding protein